MPHHRQNRRVFFLHPIRGYVEFHPAQVESHGTADLRPPGFCGPPEEEELFHVEGEWVLVHWFIEDLGRDQYEQQAEAQSLTDAEALAWLARHIVPPDQPWPSRYTHMLTRPPDLAALFVRTVKLKAAFSPARSSPASAGSGLRGVMAACRSLGEALPCGQALATDDLSPEQQAAVRALGFALDRVREAADKNAAGGPRADFDTGLAWLDDAARQLWQSLPRPDRERAEPMRRHAARLWDWIDAPPPAVAVEKTAAAFGLVPGGFIIRGRVFKLVGRPRQLLKLLFSGKRYLASDLLGSMGVDAAEREAPEQVVKMAAVKLRKTLRGAMKKSGMKLPKRSPRYPILSCGRGSAELTYWLEAP